MTVQKSAEKTNAQRAAQLWLLVGMGTIFYLLIHTLQTVFIGVPSGFAGKEHQAIWSFTAMMGLVLAPALLSVLSAASTFAWLVLAVGVVGALLMVLVAWQYGVGAGAGYITLVVVVFVLIPQGLALWRTVQWARTKH